MVNRTSPAHDITRITNRRNQSNRCQIRKAEVVEVMLEGTKNPQNSAEWRKMRLK
jgi:hypothetical protein